ncbi:MAG: 3-oxoacyl-[acyl-carrier-protein] synthase III C-terminal domain-containing protein [Verrucomicrobiota bacterium]
MYLQSIAHSVPSFSLSQAECWQVLENSQCLDRLNTRSIQILEKILLGDSGIEKRHFAAESAESIFGMDAEALNQNFEARGPLLASDAIRKALEKAELKPSQLDALVVSTCTGYLCPGLSSHISEQLGLNPDAFLQDVVGLGCGAAIPTLRNASHIISASPESIVACVSVELCSSAFYLDNDPGVLISACLFGDAASATIWGNRESGNSYRISNFDTIHLPENRELIRFVNSGGKLRNKLHRSLPEKAAESVAKLYSNADLVENTAIANHTGGRDVINALEKNLPTHSLQPSRDTLRRYGNTSSPSVMITLEQILEAGMPEKEIWLTSFGAGFAAHSCSLKKE